MQEKIYNGCWMWIEENTVWHHSVVESSFEYVRDLCLSWSSECISAGYLQVS